MRAIFFAFGLFLNCLPPNAAFAWSARAHKTMAEIGFGLLSSNVRSKVTAVFRMQFVIEYTSSFGGCGMSRAKFV